MRQMTKQQYSDWLQSFSRATSCGSKKAYADQKEAEFKARSNARELGPMSAYRCIHCDGVATTAQQHRLGHALSMKFESEDGGAQ